MRYSPPSALKGILPDDIREIAICRPTLINRAWMEWNAHAPILLNFYLY
jgi:hypothetical protein